MAGASSGARSTPRSCSATIAGRHSASCATTCAPPWKQLTKLQAYAFADHGQTTSSTRPRARHEHRARHLGGRRHSRRLGGYLYGATCPSPRRWRVRAMTGAPSSSSARSVEAEPMRMRTLLLTTTALLPIVLSSAVAGPEGGTVVGGAATISGQGSAHVIVNQSSQNAIVNWNTFNVGVGEARSSNSRTPSSAILNRVTGGLGPSQILGSIDANGRVFIVNRDGIVFGAGAVIKTAGFLATTSDIRNSDFMAGTTTSTFRAGRTPRSSIGDHHGDERGLCGAGGAGRAQCRHHHGHARHGSASGGQRVLARLLWRPADHARDRRHDRHQVRTCDRRDALVADHQYRQAEGEWRAGRLTAAAARHVVNSVINTSGVVEANSVAVKNGRIVLRPRPPAPEAVTRAACRSRPVKISGTLSAAGRKAGTKGGNIIVTAENVEVAGAKIDASGRAGGGTVMIGGDGAAAIRTSRSPPTERRARGQRDPDASTVGVDAATTINASAIDSGLGGKVMLWSGRDEFCGRDFRTRRVTRQRRFCRNLRP